MFSFTLDSSVIRNVQNTESPIPNSWVDRDFCPDEMFFGRVLHGVC